MDHQQGPWATVKHPFQGRRKPIINTPSQSGSNTPGATEEEPIISLRNGQGIDLDDLPDNYGKPIFSEDLTDITNGTNDADCYSSGHNSNLEQRSSLEDAELTKQKSVDARHHGSNFRKKLEQQTGGRGSSSSNENAHGISYSITRHNGENSTTYVASGVIKNGEVISNEQIDLFSENPGLRRRSATAPNLLVMKRFGGSQNFSTKSESITRPDEKGRFSKNNSNHQIIHSSVGKVPIKGPVNDPTLLSPLSNNVEHSDRKSNFCRYLSNIGNATIRQKVAVGIPTYLRQPTAMAIQHLMQNLSPTEYRYVAWAAVAYPIILNLLGAWGDRSASRRMEIVVGNYLNKIKDIEGIKIRGTITEDDRKELVALFKNDNKHVSQGFELIARRYLANYDEHKKEIEELVDSLKEQIGNEYWHTPSSEVCRVLMGALVLAAAITADQKKLLGDLAPTLVAFNMYCQLRDVFQSFFALNDGVKKFYLPTALVGGLAYFANQLCVGFLMKYYASPSGQSAANATFAVNGTYADVVGNDLKRAAFNTGGEIVDLLVLTCMQCWAMKKAVTLKLEIACPSTTKIKKTVTGIHAARTNLFAFNVIFAAVLADMLNLDPCAGAFVGAVMGALTDAGILGACYSIFLGLADRANWTEDSSIQSGGEAIR